MYVHVRLNIARYRCFDRPKEGAFGIGVMYHMPSK